MPTPRHLIAAGLLGSLALGLSLPASADRGEHGWGGRHHHHHHHDRGAYYYGPPPVYAAPAYAPPPRVVYQRPIIYAPQPVHAYPSRPAVTIDIAPLVIPLR